MNPVLLSILKVLTSLSSVGIYMSPIPSMKRVHQTKSTGEMQLLPLVGMFCNYHLLYVLPLAFMLACTIDQPLTTRLSVWLHRTLYGLFKGDIFPVSVTTLLGQVMAVIYITIFALATADRAYALKIIGLAAIPVVLTTLYAVLVVAGVTGQSSDDAVTVFGYVSLLTTIGFYASPLATLRRVVQTQNAASIPIGMVVAGTICNSLWTLYGLAKSDMFLFVPNAVCVCLGVVQILLYAKYNPNRRTAGTDQTEDGGIRICIELSPKAQKQLSASPVFQAMNSPPLAAISGMDQSLRV